MLSHSYVSSYNNKVIFKEALINCLFKKKLLKDMFGFRKYEENMSEKEIAGKGK